MSAAHPEDFSKALAPDRGAIGRDLVRGVFAAVAYRDVFRFPMTATEIHRFVQTYAPSQWDTETVLARAVSERLLSTDGEYYALAGREALFDSRKKDAQLSPQFWQKARAYASLLATIPTIRMISVTGSLANDNVRPGDDIDFMVITTPGSLWLTRALVKVLQLTDGKIGSGQMCVNYFRSEAALEIDDRCLYMAQEIAQMVPLYGMETYRQFRRCNEWTRDFLPNANGHPPRFSTCQPWSNRLRKAARPVMVSRIAAAIESWESRRKIHRYNETDFLPGRFSPFGPEATGHRLAVRDAVQRAFECRMRDFRDPVRPLRVLFGQAYHLFLDNKLWGEMRPFPPLGSLYAAAVARRDGHDVHFFDSMVSTSITTWAEKLDQRLPDVAILYEDNFNYLTKMCLSNMRDAAVSMIRLAGERDIPVFVCSSDATDNADLYLDVGARYVVLGEGEATVSKLLELFAGGRESEADRLPGIAFRDAAGGTVYNARPPPLRRIDSLPEPAHDLVDWKLYRSMWIRKHKQFAVNVVTTRGCPYHCNWCAKPIWGQSYQARSPENVAAEIATLAGLSRPDYIWFMDDIFGLKPGWIARFADAMDQNGLRLPFKCLSRPDILLREGEIGALQRAGCDVVWMGAESGSQKILDAMEKGTRVEQIEQATRELRARGIRVGHFIQFGYPGESGQDIAATLQLLRRTLPDELGISVSYPLPGTKFHDRVVAELGGKRNWTDSDDLAVLFNSPYSTRFYRALHRYTHTWLGFHRNVKKMTDGLDRRFGINMSVLAAGGRAVVLLPRLCRLWLRMKFFQRTGGQEPPVIRPELSPKSAALPSPQLHEHD